MSDSLANNELNLQIRERLYTWLMDHYKFESSDKPNISLASQDAGMTRQSLSYVLTGRQRLTSDLLHQLSTLGIDIHWLVTGHTYPKE